MRGTGMAINYMPVGDPRYEPVRGVYVANKDVYKILIASENAAHSEWDLNLGDWHKTSRRRVWKL